MFRGVGYGSVFGCVGRCVLGVCGWDLYMCVCICVGVYIYVCMYMCGCIYICVYVHMS